MKTTVLGGILALSLTLASCGGPTAPVPISAPNTAPTPAPQTMPADAPEDATAARELLVSAKRTGALSASEGLSAQGLGQQAKETVDLGNRLRVVLGVTRKSGKVRATAVFLWANHRVNLTGDYLLALEQTNTGITQTPARGELNLTVPAGEYQIKRTRVAPALVSDESMCAVLTFNLRAGEHYWGETQPVRVCESDRRIDEFAYMQRFLRRYPKFYMNNVAPTTWQTIRLSDSASGKPTKEWVAEAFNLAGADVEEHENWDFELIEAMARRAERYGPAYLDSEGRIENREWWKSWSHDDNARRFPDWLSVYWRDIRVYKIRVSDSKDLYFVGGWNGRGVAGYWAYGVHHPVPRPAPPPLDTRAYGVLAYDDFAAYGSVSVFPHRRGAVITGRYRIRISSLCAADLEPMYDKVLIEQIRSGWSDGSERTWLSIEAVEANADLVMDYEVVVDGVAHTGFACAIPEGGGY